MPRAPRRPMSNSTRARLGGLGLVTRHGPDHMEAIGRLGASALDRRIAKSAGIPDDIPEEEYRARLKAARTAHYIRMAEKRWANARRRAG